MKIPPSAKDLELGIRGLRFKGEIEPRRSRDFAKITGLLAGEIEHPCDLCGKDFLLEVEEEIEAYAQVGSLYEKEDDILLNVYEFKHELDLESLIESELEAFLSDYFYCAECAFIKKEG